MRSEGGEAGVDCDDPVIALACNLDSEDCPAACKDNGEEDNKTDEKVRSGDLVIKVTPAEGKKATISGGVSDLDTITLKASEAITVDSITLERFGYSTANDVASVWLEDANGNKIADEKSLSNSKDTVTLKIKKEYREMEASNDITIVLKTSNTAKAGGTIGFKVTDVDASAKNLDLSDYNPYTYELVKYDGAIVKVNVKGNDKKYNYEEGEYYEVSRLNIKAGDAILNLNGITLTNKGGKVQRTTTTGGTYNATTCTGDADWDATIVNAGSGCQYTSKTSYTALDLDEFVSKVKVTADGKEVSGLKYNVTKDNELVLSWDTIEVAIRKDVQIIVSIAMENLDEFSKQVRLVLNEEGDLNAVEKKTGARVTVDAPDKLSPTWKVYTFEGSKIKFVNTKLSSTIEAAQGSSDVVIAKGKINVAEEVKLTDLVFETTTTGAIEDMTLTIAGENYDASVSSDKTKFTFKNVFIEKSGEFELSVDVVDEEYVSGKEVVLKVGVTTASSKSIGKDIFNPKGNGRYESSREDVDSSDVSGSISISTLKIQESKGSFTNKQTTKKNVVVNENKDVEVFNGTYTAKKGAIFLDNVEIKKVRGAANGADISFKVTIDGQDVADIDAPLTDNATEDQDFDAIEVAAGESVDVVVTATAYAESGSTVDFEYQITVKGKDDKNNDAGSATKTMAKIAFVPADKITVSTSSSAKKQDVILASDNQVISWFVVEPEKKAENATIDDVRFDITSLIPALTTASATFESEDPDNFFDFAIGKYTADDMAFARSGSSTLLLKISDMDAKIEKATDAKLTFTETLKSSIGGTGVDYTISLVKVNEETQKDKEFMRKVVNSLVTVSSQTKEDGETEYVFEIEYSDDATNNSIQSVEFTYDTPDGAGSTTGKFLDVSEGKNGYTAKNIKDSPRYVTQIKWIDGDNQTITLGYDDYADFFKVGGKRIQTFANS